MSIFRRAFQCSRMLGGIGMDVVYAQTKGQMVKGGMVKGFKGGMLAGKGGKGMMGQSLFPPNVGPGP